MIKCKIMSFGTLTLVLPVLIVSLSRNLLYSRNLGFKPFAPNAECNVTCDRSRLPDRVINAFGGNSTFPIYKCMLLATAYPMDNERHYFTLPQV